MAQEAMEGMLRMGFSFVEVGSVCLYAQPGVCVCIYIYIYLQCQVQFSKPLEYRQSKATGIQAV